MESFAVLVESGYAYGHGCVLDAGRMSCIYSVCIIYIYKLAI